MENTIKPNGKFHFAWVQGGLGIITLFVTIGLVITTYSAYSPYIVEAWGLSGTDNGMLVSIRTISGVIGTFLCGVYYKLFSLRTGLTIGIAMGAIGYVILAFGNGFAMAAIAMGFLGASRGFAGMVPVAMLIHKWFKKHKALMMGATSAASGVATIVVPPLVIGLIEDVGITGCFLVLAAIWGGITLLMFLLCRNSPEAMGLKPLGADDVALEETKQRKKALKELHPYRPERSDQMITLLAFCFTGFTHYCHNAFDSLALVQAGYQPAEFAWVLSVFGFFVMAFKIIYGRVSDTVPQHLILLPCGLAMIIGYVIHSSYMQPWYSLTWTTIAFFFECFAFPLVTSGCAILAIDMARNEQEYGTLVRYYSLIYNLSGSVTATITGAVADATGSYEIPYLILAAACIPAYGLLFYGYKRAHRRYKDTGSRGMDENATPATNNG